MNNSSNEMEKLTPPKKITDKLYPAAIKLFSENDFHNVNVRELSACSHVSLGTIYKYFDSKEDVLFSAIEVHFKNIDQMCKIHIQGLEDPKEIFRKLLWVTMDYYDKHPEVAIIAFITIPQKTWMSQRNYYRSHLELEGYIREKFLKHPEIDPCALEKRTFLDIYYMICYRKIYMWFYAHQAYSLVDSMTKDFELYWKLFIKL